METTAVKTWLINNKKKGRWMDGQPVTATEDE
jgi:hypothetical protein